MTPVTVELQRHYRDLDLPVAVVVGGADQIADVGRQSQRLHDELPNSTLIVVPGMGLMIHHLRPHGSSRLWSWPRSNPGRGRMKGQRCASRPASCSIWTARSSIAFTSMYFAWSQRWTRRGSPVRLAIHRKIGMSGGHFTNHSRGKRVRTSARTASRAFGRLHAEAYGGCPHRSVRCPGHGLYWPISLFAWALAADYVKVDPTLGIKLLAGKNDEAGFHAWTEEELARSSPSGSSHPSAPCLRPPALHTALRRGDAVRPGRPLCARANSRSAPKRPACR